MSLFHSPSDANGSPTPTPAPAPAPAPPPPRQTRNMPDTVGEIMSFLEKSSAESGSAPIARAASVPVDAREGVAPIATDIERAKSTLSRESLERGVSFMEAAAAEDVLARSSDVDLVFRGKPAQEKPSEDGASPRDPVQAQAQPGENPFSKFSWDEIGGKSAAGDMEAPNAGPEQRPQPAGDGQPQIQDPIAKAYLDAGDYEGLEMHLARKLKRQPQEQANPQAAQAQQANGSSKADAETEARFREFQKTRLEARGLLIGNPDAVVKDPATGHTRKASDAEIAVLAFLGKPALFDIPENEAPEVKEILAAKNQQILANIELLRTRADVRIDRQKMEQERAKLEEYQAKSMQEAKNMQWLNSLYGDVQSVLRARAPHVEAAISEEIAKNPSARPEFLDRLFTNYIAPACEFLAKNGVDIYDPSMRREIASHSLAAFYEDVQRYSRLFGHGPLAATQNAVDKHTTAHTDESHVARGAALASQGRNPATFSPSGAMGRSPNAQGGNLEDGDFRGKSIHQVIAGLVSKAPL